MGQEQVGKVDSSFRAIIDQPLRARQPQTPLSKERMGELALLYLKYKMGRDGVKLTPEFRRQIGDAAQKLGVKFDEALAFTRQMISEMTEGALQ